MAYPAAKAPHPASGSCPSLAIEDNYAFGPRDLLIWVNERDRRNHGIALYSLPQDAPPLARSSSLRERMGETLGGFYYRPSE